MVWSRRAANLGTRYAVQDWQTQIQELAKIVSGASKEKGEEIIWEQTPRCTSRPEEKRQTKFKATPIEQRDGSIHQKFQLEEE
jgi:hypothetical protein